MSLLSHRPAEGTDWVRFRSMPQCGYSSPHRFACGLCASMEGMVSREDFLQLNQAKVIQSALQAIAIEIATCPKDRETAKTAGLRTKATMSSAAVLV